MALSDYGFGALPGALAAKWPRGGDGEPVPPVCLTHLTSLDMADTMLVSLLDAYGIPAIVSHPGDGSFGKVVLGMSGTGSDILVPETMYDDAKAIMEAKPDDELQG